ncbi:MAG: TIGR02757 family protein [Bacteroidetes bacterium GWB2_41_8]|nr:MAG: TIGR02757 family protein [Bacteroidetes bacterium GWB2_41_8]
MSESVENLQSFLDQKVNSFNHTSFIETDPIQVPAQFTTKENIEIAGFLSATLAWGQRPTIIRNAMRLITLMNNNPIEFLRKTTEDEWDTFLDFKHRTFNGIDCIYFLKVLKHIYQNHNGLEQVFTDGYLKDGTIFSALVHFRKVFFELEHEHRTEKHVSDVMKGAAAKRLNMYLRWMIRSDNTGVDFGLWKQIPASALMLPLDVHTGNVARKLGLLTRTQNDWRAVEEITAKLREFDPNDPVKYDFALFGLGVFEGF